MSFLNLSPGHKVKIGLTFESPDEEFIALGATEDAKAAIAEGLMDHEVTDDLIDDQMGLKSQPIAQLTIMHKNAFVADKTVFMTEAELRLHVYECRAALKSMEEFGELVDREMKSYRKGVRRHST